MRDKRSTDPSGMTKRASILVVDDEEGARAALEVILEDNYRVIGASSGREALRILKTQKVDAMLLDLNMPGMDGIETLTRVKEIDDNVDVIMVSAVDKASKAVEALKLGAYDYITKPFEPDDIYQAIERALDRRRLKREVEYLKSELDQYQGERRIITKNKKMLEVLDLIERVAHTNSTVIIYGESGTGKELVARAIHEKGPRKSFPFVAVNCGAIPSELMESEFFGHEKGAFTGATKRRLGKFEFADGGTLFLDEIATLPQSLQVKLLRVIQERRIERVGSNVSIDVDVRIIAATNVDLKEEVSKGRFRSDLYYRLNVVPIHLPPLRERKEDIPLLIHNFLKKFSKAFNKPIKGISPDALDILINYHWPGNIRELENLVERMVVLATGDTITLRDLPVEVFTTPDLLPSSLDKVGLKEACQSFEKRIILECLKKTGWNQTKAARLLKIHRNTLIAKMKGLGINLEVDSKEPSG